MLGYLSLMLAIEEIESLLFSPGFKAIRQDLYFLNSD